MNIITGNIESVAVNQALSLVKVSAGGLHFTTIVIDTPETAPYLVPGNTVKVIFKETEVILSPNANCKISLRNQIPGKIIRIDSDKLLSKLVIDSVVGKITSIITTNAVNQLGLEEGKDVFAMIKTNELMLSE